jgi:pimeloyl-ACP methyl ester carboxylesterase
VLPGDSERVAFWIGGTRNAMPNEYRDASPANFITSDDPPMYFFHGQQDLLVPIQSPIEMVKQLKAARVSAEMHPIQDAGHIQALFDRGALEQGLAFADKYLLKKGEGVAKRGNSETPVASAKGGGTKPAAASQTGGGM